MTIYLENRSILIDLNGSAIPYAKLRGHVILYATYGESLPWLYVGHSMRGSVAKT